MNGDAGERLAALGQRGRDRGRAGQRDHLAQPAGPPAALPDLALQFGPAGQVGRVGPVAAELGRPDQEAELAQLGQHRRRLRVRRRPHRMDPERLRPRAFQPREHVPGRAAAEGQPQAIAGQLGAQRRRPGLQVEAAELTATGVQGGQPGPEFGQRRAGPSVGRGQLGPREPPQQHHLERPAASAGRGQAAHRVVAAAGDGEGAGRQQLGLLGVLRQPVRAQPAGQLLRLDPDPARAARPPAGPRGGGEAGAAAG